MIAFQQRNYINTRTAPNKANIPELTTRRSAPLEVEEVPAADLVLLAVLPVAEEPVEETEELEEVPVG